MPYSFHLQLEARFGLDLTEQKTRIKALTLKVIDERAAEAEEEEGDDDDDGSSSGSRSDSSEDEDEEEEEEDEKPKKRGGGGFNKEHAWSEDMTAFLGGSGYATRGEVHTQTCVRFLMASFMYTYSIFI